MLKTKYQNGEYHEQVDGGDWRQVVESPEDRVAADGRIAAWSDDASEVVEMKSRKAEMRQQRHDQTPEEKEASDRTFQEMASAGHGPMVNGTDSQWFTGWGTGNQYEGFPVLGDKLRELAEKKAPGCTKNAQRNHQIATGIDDPRAFIKSRGELLKRAEELGRDCDTGAVKYVAPEREIVVPKIRLAEDIVTGILKSMVRRDPGLLQRRKQSDLREEIIEKHGAKE